jgi:hypothetical protein
MNVLTLSIKQKYFDEIVAGTKKKEYREIRPKNFSRYCRYVLDGKEYAQDSDLPEGRDWDNFVPVKYDAIKFLTGEYKGKRPYAVVEVKGAEAYILTDENDEPIEYEGSDGKVYVMAEIEYELGNVLERCNYI